MTLGATGLLLALLRMHASLFESMPAVVASAWVCAAMVSAVMALLQYFGQAQQLSPWVPGSPVGNAYAALRQRNQFATLTLIGQIALLTGVSQGERWRYAIPAMLLLAAGNAASASRTGALGLVLLCLAPLAWPSLRRRRVALCLLAGVGGYMLSAAVLPAMLAQWQGVIATTVFDRITASSGCGSRTVLWSNVVDLVALKPWLGWGWGELDYAHYATLYPGRRFCDILDNAHLLPLHIAVELGVPAALLVTVALMGLVVANAPWRELRPHRQMAWMVLAVILLHSLLEYPLWYGPFCLAVAASVAVLCQSKGSAQQARRSDWEGKALSTAAAALVGVALFAGWDYWRVSQVYLPPQERSPAYRDDPLSKARNSWLFGDQVAFAELTTTQLTRHNASHIADLARRLIHYSPEPRVIRALIDSLTLLGRDDEALVHLARFRAAFPAEYAEWRANRRVQPLLLAPSIQR
ncbi:MAG: PglL family O-oligosaccharyltransferase [Ramlibacter sp.]